jgi:RNA polymerase sigma-70 factor, ECF subfamily
MKQETLLLDRLRAGDGQAFDAVVRQYDQRMHAVARRLLRHGEDSADAVQDALLAAYRSIASFKGDSRIWTWLYRVLVNACLTIRRSQHRRRTVSFAGVPPDIRDAAWSPIAGLHTTESAHRHAERTELRAQVRGCIERLPKRYREVLLLRDIEELDTEQTAQRLGTSRGTVKTRLHRARQALRVLLEPTLRAQPGAEGSKPRNILRELPV